MADDLVSGKRTLRAVLIDHGSVPSTADPEVAALLDVSSEIERHSGSPRDVEWAWGGGQLWVLQARPITVQSDERDVFDDLSESLDGEDLTTVGIAEMPPGALPLLRWEVCSYAVEEALHCSIASAR